MLDLHSSQAPAINLSQSQWPCCPVKEADNWPVRETVEKAGAFEILSRLAYCLYSVSKMLDFIAQKVQSHIKCLLQIN